MSLFVKPPKHPESTGETERKLRALLDAPPDAPPDTRADMYKFYQERVETLRSRLWTMLAWLAGVQGALLAFVVKEFHFGVSPKNFITMDQPVLVLVMSIFGVALSAAMFNIIDDGTRHIEVNWRRADLSLGKCKLHSIEEDVLQRRGNHPVCKVMAQIAGWTQIAQIFLFCLALAIVGEKLVVFLLSTAEWQ